MAQNGNIQANKFVSPKFLKAKTPEKLEEMMLTNNIRDNKVYTYQIMVSGNFFYAWYDYDHKGKVRLKLRGEK